MPPPLLLLLLLPILGVDAQSGTGTPSTSECFSELTKIHECAKNISHYMLGRFHHVANIVDDWAQMRMIAGVPELYFCMGDMKCPTSQKYRKYLIDHEWVISQWHGTLKECLIDTGLERKIKDNCHTLSMNFFPFFHPHYCDVFISSTVPCALAELEKYPKECPSVTKKLFEWVMRTINANCHVEIELYNEFLTFGINPVYYYWDPFLTLPDYY